MKTIKIILVTSVAFFSTITIAGSISEIPVTVTLNEDGSGSMSGSMSTARFSDNDVEFIGCGTRNIDAGQPELVRFAFCQGGTAAGEEGFCSTLNPALVDILDAIADNSFVLVNFDANGDCISIGLSTQSFYIPDGKKAK
jgi:hypothetical protein